MNGASQGNNDRECWAQDWLAAVFLCQMTTHRQVDPGLPIFPDFLGKAKIPYFSQILFLHTKDMVWNMAAQPSEAVGGVDPLRRACGQGKQTLILLEQPHLHAFTETVER